MANLSSPFMVLFSLLSFASPASYRLNQFSLDLDAGQQSQLLQDHYQTSSFVLGAQNVMASDHDSHPDLGHLVLLVFEAVLEVICISLPGYILARTGQFDVDKQKWVANLNIQLFTPCLSRSSLMVYYAL